jgi:hypothetical protein
MALRLALKAIQFMPHGYRDPDSQGKNGEGMPLTTYHNMVPGYGTKELWLHK